jgi:hypothetical protein
MQDTHSQPCVTSHTIFILHGLQIKDGTLSPSQFKASHNRSERSACLASGEQVETFRSIPVNYLLLLGNSFNPHQVPQRMLMQSTIYKPPP